MHRIAGDDNSPAGERAANGHVVEEPGKRTGIDLSRLSATGAAIERGGLRIVGTLAAMSDEHEQSRETGGGSSRAKRGDEVGFATNSVAAG